MTRRAMEGMPATPAEWGGAHSYTPSFPGLERAVAEAVASAVGRLSTNEITVHAESPATAAEIAQEIAWATR